MGFHSDAPEAGSKEITSSWALFIMIMLLMFALFTSYMLQQKKIQAVHETVLSIFAGMHIPRLRCALCNAQKLDREY
jgi:sodium/hydrogen exchanger-like protein 6/7